MKCVFSAILLILLAGSAKANDSTYVRFLNRKIALDDGERFFTFSVKKETYLFVPKQSGPIECFVFRRNRLIKSGRLTVKEDDNSKIAYRNGYWLSFNKANKQSKIFFINDEQLEIETDIPIKSSID